MLIPGIGMLILPAIDLRFISFGAAIYLFFRSFGASIGVSAVLVLLDIRQTLHSSRLLDTANQLNPRLAQALRAITGVVQSRGIAINSSSLGADQLFSGLVNTQARLLSFIDVFWVLQILGLVGILLLLISRSESTGVSNVSDVDHTSVAINTKMALVNKGAPEYVNGAKQKERMTCKCPACRGRKIATDCGPSVSGKQRCFRCRDQLRIALVETSRLSNQHSVLLNSIQYWSLQSRNQ